MTTFMVVPPGDVTVFEAPFSLDDDIDLRLGAAASFTASFARNVAPEPILFLNEEYSSKMLMHWH
jgi:hypothetical protein